MKKLLLIALVFLQSTLTISQPLLEWENRFDLENGGDIPEYLQVDWEGNIFILGISNVDTFYDDILLTKSDPEGTTLWYHLIRNIFIDETGDLKLDQSGNSFISGQFGYVFASKPAFTMKLNTDGDVEWVDSVAGEGRSLSIDSYGNCYSLYASLGINVVKYDMAGNRLLDIRSDTFITGDLTNCNSIHANSDGSFYINGDYTGADGDTKYFLKKFSANGELLWDVKYNPTEGDDDVRFMEIDSSGNIYILGHLDSSEGMALVKFDSSGNLLWDQIILDSSGIPYALQLDNKANPIICGAVSEVHSIEEFTTIKYDLDSSVIWTDYQDSIIPSYSKRADLAADNEGNIFFAGVLRESIGIPHTLLMIKYDTLGSKLWEYRNDELNIDHDIANIALDPQQNIIVSLMSVDSITSADFLTLKFSQVTGISETVLLQSAFHINPNPFHSTANFQLTDEMKNLQGITLEVIDLFGRIVRSEAVENADTHILDRGGLANGIYFIRLTNEKQFISTCKIVVY